MKKIKSENYFMKVCFSFLYILVAFCFIMFTGKEVSAKEQSISSISKIDCVYEYSGRINLKASAPGHLTYRSNDTSVVTVTSSGTAVISGYGKTTITITAERTSHYEKTQKTIPVTIRPYMPSITGVEAVRKDKMKVSWKKDSRVTGYVIYRSVYSDFRKTKNYVIGSKDTTELSSTGTSGRAYYFRMRTYKASKYGNIYSAWSPVKKIVCTDTSAPPSKPIAQRISSISEIDTVYSYNKKIGLKASAPGNLTYKSSNTSVISVSSSGTVTVKGYGKASITITAAATSRYLKAIKTVPVTILPVKQEVGRPQISNKLKMLVTWKKDSRSTGYVIEVANSKDFKTNKQRFVKENNITNLVIPGKKGKSYYFRVRSYKRVGTINIYGSWSDVRSAVCVYK